MIKLIVMILSCALLLAGCGAFSSMNAEWSWTSVVGVAGFVLTVLQLIHTGLSRRFRMRISLYGCAVVVLKEHSELQKPARVQFLLVLSIENASSAELIISEISGTIDGATSRCPASPKRIYRDRDTVERGAQAYDVFSTEFPINIPPHSAVPCRTVLFYPLEAVSPDATQASLAVRTNRRRKAQAIRLQLLPRMLDWQLLSPLEPDSPDESRSETRVIEQGSR